MYDEELVREILSQILTALDIVLDRFSPVKTVDWERRFNSLPDSPADFYSNNNVNSLPLPIFFHLIP